MIESGVVDIEDSFGLNDRQGFGMYQNRIANGLKNAFDLQDLSDMVKLPNFYAFKEIGELLDENPVFYKIGLLQGDVRNEKEVFTNRADAPRYALADAYAWGFGDAQGLKKIVVINRTDAPIEVSLQGCMLKPGWVYGGIENIFPKFLTYPISSGLWTDAPDVIPVPEHPDAGSAAQIQIKPFSVTVCEVSVGG